eukprot:TRINITY_DN884_c0_g1_i1.p1 TRINITY_DN884_c0_g1~~TRINITY_DN884_c0_g1_i1.p1  ORF type:complete len:347 (+),score=97.52 TRINITY_DN884_c0_g1_i1:58-1098(+)
MTTLRIVAVVIALLMTMCCAQQLPGLNIDVEHLRVSGVSSGAAMAVQLHVSYSTNFDGVGVLAGPPYWCAMANLASALGACMLEPELINLPLLWEGTAFAYAALSIDNPVNLKRSRAWIFTGQLDTVVKSECVAKTQQYYQKYIPSSQISYTDTIPAEHAMISNTWGSNCSYLGFPWINNCNYDAAGILLNYLNGSPLQPRVPMNMSNLLEFTQDLYMPLNISPSVISMADQGFVYVPTGCRNSANVCMLHVFLHGCVTGIDDVGNTIAVHAGLNEWAEANNIVVLYPQAKRSQAVPYNPQGCWDWWGYTGADYATRLAPQVVAIKNMIDALSSSKLSASRSSVAA